MTRILSIIYHNAFALSIVSVGCGFTASAALAQSPACACSVPAGSTGAISQPAGDVVVSQKVGFVSASTNAPLSEGSRVIVGHSSGVTVNLPGCTVDLKSSSVATLMRIKDQLCLQVENNTPGIDQQNARSSSAAFSWAPTAFIGALAVAGVAVAIADDDKPVSR